MTAAGATTYQWDGANRLKSVNNGTSGSYGFDGNGKRVKKTEGGASTYYVYSSVIGSAVMEVATTGVQRAYVMNGGNVVAQRNADGQFYWLHPDHLGSGRKMTDTSGNLTYRAEFDPYGKLILEWSLGNQANRNSKKFTGYERDAGSGLDFAQARMYGSEWGRFMSPDPVGIMSASSVSPKSFNQYSYVDGDPVNKVDPSGLYGQSVPPTVVPGTKDGFTVNVVGDINPNPLATSGGGAVVRGEIERAYFMNYYQSQFLQNVLKYITPAVIPKGTQSERAFSQSATDFFKNNPECAKKINFAASLLGKGTIEDAIKNTKIVDVIENKAAYNLDSGLALGRAATGDTLGEQLSSLGLNGVFTYALTDWVTFSAQSNPIIYFGGAYAIRDSKGITNVAVHEMLHSLFKQGHPEIANLLNITVAGNDEASAITAIQGWLEKKCTN